LLSHLEALSGDVAAIKAAQAGIASALLAEGLGAEAVVRLVNGINLDLHRRILAETLADHGTAPVAFTLLVMGSLGRGESLLTPDQDNGLILEDYPDQDHARVDAWFRPFTEDFNQRLDQAGFPLCPGGIMARNPLWRKPHGNGAIRWASGPIAAPARPCCSAISCLISARLGGMGLRRLRSANTSRGYWLYARPGWRPWQRRIAACRWGSHYLVALPMMNPAPAAERI
jgi:hypothetical protein